MLLAFAFIGQQIAAFSTKNIQRRISSRLLADNNIGGQFFQDDECEDLCEAFGDEALVPSLGNSVQDTVLPQSKSVMPMKQIKRSLWSDPKPTKCKSCNGVGSHVCRFCGGVSFLSGIGGETDALFFDGIGKRCPVCDDGYETCRECSGTGYIFSWNKPRDDAGSLRP